MSFKTVMYIVGGAALVGAAIYGVTRLTESETKASDENGGDNDGGKKDPEVIPPLKPKGGATLDDLLHDIENVKGINTSPPSKPTVEIKPAAEQVSETTDTHSVEDEQVAPSTHSQTLQEVLDRHKETVDRLHKSFTSMGESDMTPDVKKAVAANAFEIMMSSDMGMIGLLCDMHDSGISEEEVRGYFREVFAILHKKKEPVAG